MRRFNLAEPEFTYDADDPERFRAGMYRFGPEAGAVRTGTSLYELPPGTAICPYHWEAEEEEWALVLQGRPTLRTPEGEQQLDPLDCVFFMPAPEGAHLFRNDTDEPVRILMWSEWRAVSVCVYPDSDKIGVHVDGQPEASGRFRRSGRLAYFDGEA